jgi:hypothetical protein
MKKKIDKNKTDYSLAHVLYQKLGTDWYAFTEKDGDCFMTKVDAEIARLAAEEFTAKQNRPARRRAA